MLIPYIKIVNKVYDTIVANDAFNPNADTSERYVNAVEKTRFVPGKFPALTIKMLSKQEVHKALGYSPFADLAIQLSVYVGYPATNVTTKTLSELGLNAITQIWEAEQAMLLIQSKFEEWVRGDESTEGRSRRALGCDQLTEVKVHIARLVATNFRERDDLSNMKLFIAENTIIFPETRIL